MELISIADRNHNGQSKNNPGREFLRLRSEKKQKSEKQEAKGDKEDKCGVSPPANRIVSG